MCPRYIVCGVHYVDQIKFVHLGDFVKSVHMFFQTRPERYLNQPVCNFVMISRIVRVVTSRISAVIVVSLNNCAWVRDGSPKVHLIGTKNTAD